jgi:N-acetylglutamate synthase-like GNAT family acetyltransferase
MAHTIRKARADDVGVLAHLMLVWDAELPEHTKQLRGDAAYAERVARAIVSQPNFNTMIMEADGVVVGAFTIDTIQGIFSAKPFGLLNLTVYPKYRGGKLYGLKLLRRAIDEAKTSGLAWLESHPWADAHGMKFVLERLGFSELTHGYALRI